MTIMILGRLLCAEIRSERYKARNKKRDAHSRLLCSASVFVGLTPERGQEDVPVTLLARPLLSLITAGPNP
ncbi:MAG: hypothetical protein WB869_20550, partial [Candidatus Acidiferrales bacterium]